jgi:hypothetical protein
MITLAEIYLKAGRSYLPFLQSWLRGEAYLPLRFSVGKLPDDFPQLRSVVQQLQNYAKSQRGYGYDLKMRQQQTRLLGSQTLPVAVVFGTAEDFLRFVDKWVEFQHFQQDVTLVREQLPQLADWMEQYPKKVIAQHGYWPGLLTVCCYLLENPLPELYIRELPINLHTKFIEEHMGILRELLDILLPPEAIIPNALTFEQRFGLRTGEAWVLVRFLDDQLHMRYGLPLDVLSTPCSQFAQLDFRRQRCLITENKMTFLTLPRLSETFALLGGGFGVSMIAAVPWLNECPMIYWGDLDAQGFQILSQLRSLFPHVVSLMMDEQTFKTFSPFHVEGTPCIVRQLPHLIPEEHMLFLHLSERTLRLEQEHISHDYAFECIQRCFRGEIPRK